MIFKFKKLNKTLIFNGRKIMDASEASVKPPTEKKQSTKNDVIRLTVIKELLAYRLYSDIPYIKGILNDNFEVDEKKLDGATKKNIARVTAAINDNPIISTLKEINAQLGKVVDAKKEQEAKIKNIKEQQNESRIKKELEEKNVPFEVGDLSKLENKLKDPYYTNEVLAVDLVEVILKYFNKNYYQYAKYMGDKIVLPGLRVGSKHYLEQYVMSNNFKNDLGKKNKDGDLIYTESMYAFPKDVYHVDEFVAKWTEKAKAFLLTIIDDFWNDYNERLSSSEKAKFENFMVAIEKSNETPYGLASMMKNWDLVANGLATEENAAQREDNKLNNLDKIMNNAEQGKTFTSSHTGTNVNKEF